MKDINDQVAKNTSNAFSDTELEQMAEKLYDEYTYDKAKERIEQQETVDERRRIMIGIERALKHHGIKSNNPCPCGSGKKLKKCGRPLMDDTSVPAQTVLDHFRLVEDTQAPLNPITNVLLG
jgi:hypothetical protein